MKRSNALLIQISGRVQGVGFRPFVLRLARDLDLRGWCANDSGGVRIHVEGEARRLALFLERLEVEAPAGARIERIDAEKVPVQGLSEFTIEASRSGDLLTARLPIDLRICPSCRAEIVDAKNRRQNYPFTNCTDCGPRFSIIEAMPYDRIRTSMRTFIMCESCQAEYDTPTNRRYHAQPNACAACGPHVEFHAAGGLSAVGERAMALAVDALREGEVVALKGLGGYQLLGRADRAATIARIRSVKSRPSKPLAVMVSNRETAAALCRLSAAETLALESAENPIVLLEREVSSMGSAGQSIDAAVAGDATLGLFLPTTGLHEIIVNAVGVPLVVTSANVGEEPMIYQDANARTELWKLCAMVLTHDRPIVRRLDDSVVRVIDDRPVSIRAGRGIAPLPLSALEPFVAGLPPALATGGEQKVAFALWSGSQAVLGPHIGDMGGAYAGSALTQSANDLARLYQTNVDVLICDLHPDYATTRWAAEQDRTLIQVQHHHAHAAVAIVEHGLMDRDVIALTWDGTGFGPDGTIWGGEILRADLHSFERLASLRPFPLPGGEAAVRHPNRVALVLMAEALGPSTVLADARLLEHLRLNQNEASVLLTMVERGINTPWTSSVGRLFDGVSSLLLGVRSVSYEGEAAMLLEIAAGEARARRPEMRCDFISESERQGASTVLRGDWRPMMIAMWENVRRGVPPALLATQFQSTLAKWAVEVVRGVRDLPVVLGGGCFQNRRLTEEVLGLLRAEGRTAFGPGRIPPNDGGLAAGQLAVGLTQLHTNTPAKQQKQKSEKVLQKEGASACVSESPAL